MEKHSRDEPAPPPHFTDEQTEVWGGEVCAQVNSGLRAGPESKTGRSAVADMLGFLPAGPSVPPTQGHTWALKCWQRGRRGEKIALETESAL